MGKDKKTTKAARKKFKKDFKISRKKAGSMSLTDFVNKHVADSIVREGVKKAKKSKWRMK